MTQTIINLLYLSVLLLLVWEVWGLKKGYLLSIKNANENFEAIENDMGKINIVFKNHKEEIEKLATKKPKKKGGK